MMRGNELETAQGIIDALGVTVPRGDLIEGGYDERGFLYRIPGWVLVDPPEMGARAAGGDGGPNATAPNTTGLVLDGAEEDEEGLLNTQNKEIALTDSEADEAPPSDSSDIAQQRREAKGKAPQRDSISIRVRLSDREGDMTLTMDRNEKVKVLVRKLREAGNMSESARLRIVYLGRSLGEGESLVAQGWREGFIVQALVSDLEPLSPRSP